MKRLLTLLVLFVLMAASSMLTEAENSGAAVGEAAPSWLSPQWTGAESPKLGELAGKVVLVRWWTGPGCPYCRASSSSLNSWHEKYSSDGLVTVGFYHEKSATPATADEVQRLATDLGFTFPVAIDPGWRTLRKWWLDGNSKSFTSVTFLIDRIGLVRFIHPGGSYDKDETAQIEALITTLLDEE